MSAVGKVMGLDAGGLKDPKHEYAGSVVVHITCTLEQSRAWAELWGRDVQALPFIPPADSTQSSEASRQTSLNLETTKS